MCLMFLLLIINFFVTLKVKLQQPLSLSVFTVKVLKVKVSLPHSTEDGVM